MVLNFILHLIHQNLVFIFHIFSIRYLVDALENHAEFSFDELGLDHEDFLVLSQFDDLVSVVLAFC